MMPGPGERPADIPGGTPVDASRLASLPSRQLSAMAEALQDIIALAVFREHWARALRDAQDMANTVIRNRLRDGTAPKTPGEN